MAGAVLAARVMRVILFAMFFSPILFSAGFAASRLSIFAACADYLRHFHFITIIFIADADAAIFSMHFSSLPHACAPLIIDFISSR